MIEHWECAIYCLRHSKQERLEWTKLDNSSTCTHGGAFSLFSVYSIYIIPFIYMGFTFFYLNWFQIIIINIKMVRKLLLSRIELLLLVFVSI